MRSGSWRLASTGQRVCRFELLEVRTLLSIDPASLYAPPRHDLATADGYLTLPRAGAPWEIALSYLETQTATLGISADDLHNAKITAQYASADTGVTHISMRETWRGVEIVNANLNVSVTADGRVLSVGCNFVSLDDGGDVLPSVTPPVSPAAAIGAAAEELGLSTNVQTKGVAWVGPLSDSLRFTNSQLSLDLIPVRLRYAATEAGLQATWDIVFRTPDGEHWCDVIVDASDGRVLGVADLIEQTSSDGGAAPTETSSESEPGAVADSQGAAIATAVELAAAPDVISVRYDLPALLLQPTGESVDGRSVSQAVMRGTEQSSQAGQPILPLAPVAIVVPFGQAVGSIDVIPGAVVTLPGSYAIETASEPMMIDPPLAATNASAAGVADSAPVTSGTSADGLLDVVGVQRERGVDILRVNLHPVRYTVDSGGVAYYTTLTLNVTLVDAAPQALDAGQTVRYRSDDVRSLEAQVANPGALESYVEAATGGGDVALGGICNSADSYQYVAITSQAFASASTDYTINDLIASKQARGMAATVVTLESIYANYSGVDQPEQIRNFISDAYNNWETDFVLLGGDSNVLPYRGLTVMGTSIPSDLYYQCLDGNFNSDGDAYWGESTDGVGGADVDLSAEVYIGRASAGTTAEMANWVYKTIAYENTAGSDYRRQAMMVGEHLGFGGVSEYATASMEEIRLGSSAYGYTTAGFAADPTFTTSTLYDSPTYTWSASDLMNLFNSGDYGVYNHLGHANTSYVMKLNNASVDTLTNDNFFFIYSQGCYPGDFPNDAIAEHFTTSTRYGAAAVVFNSRYGWGRGNSTDGPSERPNREFWDALFSEQMNRLGVMNADSHADVLWGISDPYIRWVTYETNLFGDPAAEVVSLDLAVVGSTPAGGQVVTTPPTDFVINFSDPYLSSSVDAGDLLINGIAADSVVLSTAYSITFHYNTSPATAQGTQSMSLAAGTILRASDNGGNRVWNASFRYDAAPMQVTSIEPADSSTVLLPLTTLRVNVSEEIDPASVGTNDLTVSQGTVTGAVRTDPDTIEYALSGVTQEATLTVSLAAGALADIHGNASLAYSASMALDFGTVPFPTPLEATAPLGSLVFDSSISGQIISAGDADNFTIDLDAGQTLTAVVAPGSELTPTVTLAGPGGATGSATASGAGKQAVLQTVTAAAAGTYTVTVSSAAGTIGAYSLQLILNAAVEAESHDGAANNDFGSAQALDSAFVSLGPAGQRAAVLGVTDPTRESFLSWNMDSDPGWTYEGEWAWGQPGGCNGDPTSGHTGASVVGYVLCGQYTDNMPVYYATTPALSTLGKTGLQLSFWRWLGVESSSADHATIDVSCDGANWTSVWANSTATISDGGWRLQTYDISAAADNQAQVFLRFGMGPTNGSVTYCGWNIDDVSLSASASSNDYYSLALAAGQSATVGLTALAADATTLELYGPGQDRLALGKSSNASFDNVISNFVAPAAGTYYVHVIGTGAAYDLVATKDLGFDAGVNGSFTQAQEVGPSGMVLAFGGLTGVFYAADRATDNIYAVDPATGNCVLIGNAGHDISYSGLAYDYGKLYVSDIYGAAWSLGTIDLATGAGAIIGPQNDTDIHTLAYQDGVLYGFSGSAGLGTLDTATGNFTRIPNTLPTAMRGADYDETAGVIYAIGGDNVLYTVNVAAGTATAVGPTGITFNNRVGLAYSPLDGELYAVGNDAGANDNLYRLDKATGAALLIGPTALGEADGLEFIPGISFESLGAPPLATDGGGGGIATLAAAPGDYYRFSAIAGNVFGLVTTTPGDGPGEFVNNLDPAIELYDPFGALVAANDNGAADGRNALLDYTATVAGDYLVRVVAAANSGEYVLQIAGATGPAPAFAVASPTELAVDSRLRAAPQWTVHFNDSILLTTLDAADLTLDGAACTAVDLIDDHTAAFTLPTGLADGVHTLAIAGGALADLQNTPVTAWSGQFTLDTTAPRVISSSVQAGQTLSSGELTLTIEFNEALRTANLDAGDLRLVGISNNWSFTPAALSYDPTGTTLTIGYTGLPDDTYRLTLTSGDGRFEDVVGVDLDGETPTWPIPGNASGNGAEGGDFSFEFTVNAWGANHAPTAVDDVYNLNAYGQLTTSAPGVLANDADPDGNALAAVLVDAPVHGTLTLNADGSFVYTPQAGFSGADQFTYRASDGQAASFQPATVRLRVAYPRLLTDINTAPADSSLGNLTRVNDTLFFTAYDPLRGTELWKTDGSANGTALVKDILAGAGSANPSNLVNFNGTLFFTAFDSSGTELWKSDGTAAGTVLVKDIYSGSSNSSPTLLAVVGSTLYFSAADAANGAELWKSDGTAAGTVLVKDIYSGASGSTLQSLTAVGNTLFFTAIDLANGRELWKSDGTDAGTVMVKNLTAGSGSSTFTYITAAGSNLFFTFNDGTHGAELWKSDGTDAGTAMVKDIYATGGSSSSPAYLANWNGTLYFSANDGVNGIELWKSDGTDAGTTLVKDINAGGSSSSPKYCTAHNGALYFQAYTAAAGYELWKTDGTAAGTTLVKDIYSGSNSSSPTLLTSSSGGLYFTAATTTGTELWMSDGTAAGTIPMKDIYAGATGSSISSVTAVDDMVLFRATDGLHGVELWKCDGSAARTMIVKEIRADSGDSNPSYLANLNGTAFFSAVTAATGYELWKSDGTAAGTALVKDIYGGASSSSPQNLTAVGDTLFFAATISAAGAELWKSDGTDAGTVLVKDIYSGTSGSAPANLVNVNGTLFFTAIDSTNGRELWKSDGTDVGTVLVKSITAGSSSTSFGSSMAVIDGVLYFQANDGVNGAELWKSDGTEAGTVLVKDIYSGATGSAPSYLVNLGGVLFFQANDGTNGSELWKSDGTAAGTVLVKDIYSGSSGSSPYYLTNVNGTLFFAATDGTYYRELWKSDGTAAGTVLVKDIYSGANNSSNPGNFTNVNGTLYFTADDAVCGIELWKSNGTSSGTTRVKDIASDAADSSPSRLTNVGGTLYFTANDGASGTELWKSDGTSGGTVEIDMGFGAASSEPQNLTAVGSMLFLSAVDSVAGREVWVVPNMPQVVSIVPLDPSPTGGATVRFEVNFSQIVYGVDPSDFTLTTLGFSGAAIASVAGDDVRFVVTVALGTGQGKLWLNLVDNDSITNVDGDPLGGPMAGSGNFSSSLWYDVDRSPPTARILDVLPQGPGSPVEKLDICFNEPITGLDLSDLRLSCDGGPNLLTGGETISNSGSAWFLSGLTALTSAPGQYTLALVAAGSGIVDGLGHAMAADASMSWVVLDHAPPVAYDDAYTVGNDAPLIVAAAGVLANDASAPGALLSAALLTAPLHGTLILQADGGFTYQPASGFMGNDQFTYAAMDGTAPSAATVRITVGPLQLVKDINTTVADSNPSGFVEFNSVVYYMATDSLHGAELWRTDGTLAGTYMLKDIYPGATSSSAAYLTAFNGALYFSANDGVNGAELWRSDGTAAGTQLFADLYAGSSSSSPSYLTVVGNSLLFRATNSAAGAELWKTDGTAAGTALVKDIYAGTGGSNPVNLTNVNGTLFFQATDGVTGYELWKSDGTATGTALVKDIYSGSSSSSPANLTNVNGTLFLKATDATNGAELWRSDGTTAGTVLVKDIYSGSSSSSISYLTNVNGSLFFQATDGVNGYELWKSDGTEAGTIMVIDLYPGSASSSPTGLTVVNGAIYFAASTSATGIELWHSDGTAGGTTLVKDVCPGANTSSPVFLTLVNGTLFFVANDGSNGNELWKSDGTTAGTALAKDVYAGAGSSSPSALASAAGLLYFSATDGVHGREAWRSDGTAAGTVMLGDLRPGTADVTLANPLAVGNTLYFSATTGAAGTELWKSDLSADGTKLVKDVYSGTNSSSPANLTNVNGTLFFTANDGTNGTELWRSDGTAAGTVLVKDIYSGSSSSFPANLTNVNGRLFFTANDGTNGTELWQSDGTAAGTTLVKDIYSGLSSSYPTYLRDLGGALLFQANDGINGAELWKSDGTTAGTTLVKDIYPGSNASFPIYLLNVGGTLFFTATDATNGTELWKSDGTTAGTVLVKDVYSGAGNSTPAYLTNVNGILFFTANDFTHGTEVWKSDGTAAGTTLVKDVYPGLTSCSPVYLINAVGSLYFTADDGVHGAELWKSDGADAGTVLVKDIVAGPGSPGVKSLTAVKNALAFTANDGLLGIELWLSDGTAAGTVPIDIAPGAESSDPQSLAAVGGWLSFSATDGYYGRELWSIPLGIAPADIGLSNAQIAEDAPVGATVGTLSAVDPTHAAFTYSLASGAGGADNGLFAIAGDTLFTRVPLDYETHPQYFVRIRCANEEGLYYEKALVINVTNANEAPMGVEDDFTADASGVIAVGAPGVLANDVDPDGDPLSAILVDSPLHGVLTVQPDGSFTYTANAGFHGNDFFTYAASDGQLPSRAPNVVYLRVGAPFLAGDIQTIGGDSNPANFVSVGGVTFFTAADIAHGTELWRTDGTDAGTVLVKDIWPATASSSLNNFVSFNGALYFTANNGTSGAELWKSDGTAAGTVMVKDIYSGATGSSAAYLTALNGALYFAANDGVNGTELWRSDGTLAGTALFKDIYAGLSSSHSTPQNLVDANGTLFFTAITSSSGRELWKSDGTAAGTSLVKDINSGSTSSSPANLTNVNGTLFFSANNGSNGVELWKSDGTDAGTVLVKDIYSSTPANSSSPANLTNVNGTLFFSATDGGTGIELWKSDGTAAGTVLVKDIYSGASNASPSYLTNLDGTLLFAASNGSSYLWKSDGTTAGTVQVATSYATSPSYLTLVNGIVYFNGYDSTNYYELWRTDATAEGTTLVKDIKPGAFSSNPLSLANAGGLLYFVANNGTDGREIWTSDGTAGGTRLVQDIRKGTADATLVAMKAVDGAAYFRGTKPSTAYALFKADGTAGGLSEVSAVYPYSGNATSMVAVNGLLFYDGYASAVGAELYKSDGTAAGTVLVKDIFSGASGSSPAYFTNINGTLFFTANGSVNGTELWKSDGTAAGTVLVKDIWPGVTGSSLASLTNVNGTLFFIANDGTNGAELWKSDGTAAGTVLVKDIYTGATSSSAANLTNVNGTLFFSANNGTNGVELWKSDGTAAGTELVKDIYSGAFSSSPANLTNVNGTLFFAAYTPTSGVELWKSDGTDAGTVLVKDINPGGGYYSNPAYLTVGNGMLFFSATDGVNGTELWRSDGTSAGTVLVKDIYSGSAGSSPTYLVNVNGTLYFAANDGVNGNELWKSDGTDAGTVLAADIMPGLANSDPQALTAVLGGLAFTANDGLLGRELWVLPNLLVPQATSIIRADASPTQADAVRFTVTFAQPVTGVDVGDFILFASGLAGASIASVAGSRDVYTVTVNTGTGGGALRLDLLDNDSIFAFGTPLGGVGVDNGARTGDESYFLQRGAPEITAGQTAVTVNEGQTAANSGAFADPNGDTVTLTASFGALLQNGANSGSWSWSASADDGPAQSQVVTITATDSVGVQNTLTFSLTVVNLAPTASISGPTASDVGVVVTLNGTAADASPVDQAAGLTLNWTVIKRTDAGQAVVATGAAANLTFTPDAPGLYEARFRAVDKDGAASLMAFHLVTVAGTVPTTIAADVSAPVLDAVLQAAGDSPQAQVTITSADQAGLENILAMLPTAAVPSRTVTIDLNLTDNTTYDGLTIDLPQNVRLVLDGQGGAVVIQGRSPALIVASGEVIVRDGVTLVTSTDDPTILVTGGSLSVRNSTISETTGGDQAAIEIRGGSVDLGSSSALGGNTFDVQGAGQLIKNTGSSAVAAVGNAWRQDGVGLTSNADVEARVTHYVDNPLYGLTSWQTLTTIVVSPATVDLLAGQTQQFAAAAFDQFGDALAAPPAFDWTAASGSISTSGLYTAPETDASDVVTASSGGVSGTANVTVTAPPHATEWRSVLTHAKVGEVGLLIAADDTFAEPRNGGICKLLVNFDKPVAPASFNAAAVQIAGKGSGGAIIDLSSLVITPSLSNGNMTGVISFSAALPNLARYAVRLQGVTDAAGNLLAGDVDRVMTSLRGDASGDLRTNVTDLSYIWSVRTSSISAANVKQVRSDINMDGQINVNDLSASWARRGGDLHSVAPPVLGGGNLMAGFAAAPATLSAATSNGAAPAASAAAAPPQTILAPQAVDQLDLATLVKTQLAADAAGDGVSAEPL